MSDRRLPNLRSELDALPRYRAGRPAAPVTDRTPISLASNENPFAPLPGVVAAAQAAIATVERYPAFGADRLIAALAATTGHDPAGIVVGTGSVALLQHIAQIACHDGDEVVYAWRSFEAYPIITRVAGARPVEVPLTPDHHHDLDAMLAAITDRTRVVILCSPNNPSGTAIAPAALERVLAVIPASIVVVLDEAYIDYVAPADRPDTTRLLAAYPNLVVLRTFSKAYGLAGLRVGYGLAAAEVAEVIRAVATPFGVNAVAQAAAVASVTAPAQRDLARQVDVVVRERSYLATGLRELGLEVVEGAANFVWLPWGEAAASFAEACARDAISVRLFGGEGVRITIGDRHASDRVLAAAAAWRR